MGIPRDAPLRFELLNSAPVDLLDLTKALTAFGEAYKDYVVQSGHDLPDSNVRLFVKEIRSGSIIADLASMADQASFLLKYGEVLGGFVTHIDQILKYFLHNVEQAKIPDDKPTRRQAALVYDIMEPVAKDGGANLNISINNATGPITINNYSSMQANAIQNNARRYIGRQIPTTQVYQNQLLRLHQVRGVASSSVGDRGIIEEISNLPVKLQFVSEAVKAQIIDKPENPFQQIFLVDVEAKASEGRVRLYRVLDVKDVIQPE